MAKSGKKHPLRKLTFIAVIAGIVIAIRNSIADKGGSYTPQATPDRATAPETAEPAAETAEPAAETAEPAAETAEPAAETAPVSSGDVPHAKDFVESGATVEATTATELDEESDRMPPRGRRKGHGLARDEEIAETKIDPFGIR